MALRHVKEIELELKSVNLPGIGSIIGDWAVNQPSLRVDDTIGPVFDIKLKTPPKCKDYEKFIFVSLKVWDASMNQLKSWIYRRTLQDHQIHTPPIFQRYRVPFRKTELHLEEMATGKNEVVAYKGNPALDLRSGDRITLEVIAPWVIDIKKSKVILKFIELLGHIGPEDIRVDSTSGIDKQFSMWDDIDYMIFYTNYYHHDIKVVKDLVDKGMLTMENIKNEAQDIIEKLDKSFQQT